MSYSPPPPNDPRYGGYNQPPPYQNPQGQQPYFPEQYQQPQYGQPQYQQPAYTQPPAAPTQSGQSRGGIAGVVLFGLSMLLYVTMIGIVVAMDSDFDPEATKATTAEMLVGALFLASMAMNLIGMVSSVAGFAERDRVKVMCWVGLLLNLLPCLGCGGLMTLAVVVAAGAS